jgi:hypothetical protein
MSSKKPSKNPVPTPTDAPAKDATSTAEGVAKEAAPVAATLDQQIEALKALDLDGLRREYLLAFGHPTAAMDKDALVARITERIGLGGKGASAPKRKPGRPISGTPTAAPATKAEGGARQTTKPAGSPFTQDPRLPAPGSTISVTHKGKTFETKFLGADGFEYRGERFRSLSAIASEILGGVAVNGFLWWGLTKPAARRADVAPKPATKRPAKAKTARKPARKGKAK